MSERGSFVTEYLYCGDCFQAVEAALRRMDVEAVTLIHAVHEPRGPIILAGKACGLYPGEELAVFRKARQMIEGMICHPVTVAVLPDSAEPEFFIYQPRDGK